MSKGFTCPNCHSDDVFVIQTFQLNNAIRRRRKCKSCNITFRTFELHADLIPTTAKYDFLYENVTPQ